MLTRTWIQEPWPTSLQPESASCIYLSMIYKCHIQLNTKIPAIIWSSMILCTMSLLPQRWQQVEGANNWKVHTNLRNFILFQISASWNGIEILYYHIPSSRDIEKVWGDSAQGYSAVTYEKDFGILYISAFRNLFLGSVHWKMMPMPSIRQALIYQKCRGLTGTFPVGSRG